MSEFARFAPRSRQGDACLTGALILLGAWLTTAGTSRALAAPPNAPEVTEPRNDGQICNASDVHMETGPFSDPDPGDTHFCSTWEIWTVTAPERIWEANCVTGLEKVHSHLGDGAFVGSHAGRSELFSETNYRLQVRHRDSNGQESVWSQRLFTTGEASTVFPLQIDDVVLAPLPTWRDETAVDLELPASGTPGHLHLEAADGGLYLAFDGQAATGNALTNPPALAEHQSVKVEVSGGSSPLLTPQSQVAFTDGAGTDRVVYLPALNLAVQETAWYWISSNGSSYVATEQQTEPDFSELAQGAAVPWRSVQPGYVIEVFATGFQLPTNIAFVPNPGPNPDDPYFYVTELYGTIKVVTRDGSVSDYATDLLNFDPTGAFPGSGEQGLAGICVEPLTGDLFVSLLYDGAPPNGPHYPKVMRMHSNDGGHTVATQTNILTMPGEPMGQSHQISNVTIGPDGKLYVHLGDGFDAATALNLDSYRGKILRLNLNGSAPSDNPFYNSGNGINSRDYVFARGLRNPFGGAWRASDGKHYEVENGPEVNDRFARVDAGASYGWNGTPSSMTINALYNWVTPHAPVNIAFVQSGTFGGSGFPSAKWDRAFVTESGPTWASGPQAQGKRIVEFELAANGSVLSGPHTLVEYDGSGKATAVALAAGPDGLYFSDLYKDQGYITPIDRGANILRVRFVGTADFSATPLSGQPPLEVQFTDLSNVVSPTAWNWSFGDGGVSNAQHPSHTYTGAGLYDVRLEVVGENAIAVTQKNSYLRVGNVAGGLIGEYFDDINLTDFEFSRLDPVIDFNWGGGAPQGGMGVDDFSVRWTGAVQAEFGELYTFYTTSDDGIRLWVDDQLVINSWVDQAPTEHSGAIALAAGATYDIRVEYYERGGGAVARLEWSSPSQPREVVPPHALYPGGTTSIDGSTEDAADGVSLAPVWRGALPTPLSHSAQLSLRLPLDGDATVRLLDVTGRARRTLFEGPVRARADVEIALDVRSLPAGVYFLTAESAGGTATRRVVVVR